MKRLPPLFLLVIALLAVPLPGRAQDLKSGQRLERIAFGSCANQHEPQPIWGPIVATKPELFLFIGDATYVDLVPREGGGYRLTRNVTKELIQESYDKLAKVPGFQQLKKACPILAVWDDHDYGLNDAGSEFALKKEAQQIFLDFFNEPKDSPRRQREGVYDAKTFGPPGQRVQIILIDARYFRSPLKAGPRDGTYVGDSDPKKTFLGDAQWKWLEERLREPAELRLLCSGIQVVPEDHGWEKWMNLPLERERLFQLIKDTRANGVVFLSGDRHLAELSVMNAGVGYPIYDLTSSGLNQGYTKGWRKLETNRHRVMTQNTGNNFGFIGINWDAAKPYVSLQIRDEAGDITIQEKVPLSLLQPGTLKGKGEVAARLATGEALTAEVVKANVNKKIAIEMKVLGTGAGGAGLVFLNSEKDFTSDANFTVVLDKAALKLFEKAGVNLPRTHFEGKTIRVTGTLTEFRQRPQIMVSDPAQIEVLKK
jgi:alkaline phosphatase D